MNNDNAQPEADTLACMQVWGGNDNRFSQVTLEGIKAWVYSKPYGGSLHGGDIYYLTSCATGRVTRVLVADVAGHGDSVATEAYKLKRSMHRYINHIDQGDLVREINTQFTQSSRAGRFATAIAMTYFAPTGELTFSNAGHPAPILFKAREKQWHVLDENSEHLQQPSNASSATDDNKTLSDLPLGISGETEYRQLTLNLDHDDLILLYTDSLLEVKDGDNNRMGHDGLLSRLARTDHNDKQNLINELSQIASGVQPQETPNDDCTVLLISIHNMGKTPLRQKLKAPWLLLKDLVSSLTGKNGLSVPLPEWSLRNIGGYFIHRLNFLNRQKPKS